MNLNNVFLITDADGTLLTDDKRILEIDKSAINELIQSGGMFTVATGRGVSLARVIADELQLEIPAVIFNGAAVYDFKKDKFLWKCVLPDTAKDYINIFMDNFPTLGAEILRYDEVNVIRTNAREEEHIKFGCENPIRRRIDEVPHDNWIKTLFVDEPENIDRLIEFADKHVFDCVHLVRSAPMFFEMLPNGVNKGTGFKKLLDIMGLNNRRVVAAGDFMNDLEMIQMADLGVAVGNAEEIVKRAADLIVCDNNSGAVFEIVERLKGK